MVITDANDARKRLLDAMAQRNSLHSNTEANINTMERPSVHDIGERPSVVPQTSIPSNFLRNLYGFLNNNVMPDTIAWDTDGRSFSILNADKMETSLPMPNLYRGRFKTFKMQLEKHGFMKSSDGSRYFRPDFVKGQPQQLGDSNLSPTAVSLEDLDADIKPLSLECRIQFPKRRRIHDHPMSDSPTQTFWNSLQNTSPGSTSPNSNGLMCSVNISRNRFGQHLHGRHHPASTSSSIPSLRHHSPDLHQARLPSIGRAFPLFGLNKPSDT